MPGTAATALRLSPAPTKREARRCQSRYRIASSVARSGRFFQTADLPCAEEPFIEAENKGGWWIREELQSPASNLSSRALALLPRLTFSSPLDASVYSTKLMSDAFLGVHLL